MNKTQKKIMKELGLPIDRKTIRVLFEIPIQWVDLDSPLGILSGTLKSELYRALKEAVVSQYITKVEMPKIKIDEKELKAEILSRLADKAVDHLKGGRDDD